MYYSKKTESRAPVVPLLRVFQEVVREFGLLLNADEDLGQNMSC